ncbi:MAG: hypothetical protein JO230_22430 [Xanthobacteraceae bacterium]|nr:hypothetical protein [Xanthobacteraceae bacterium]
MLAIAFPCLSGGARAHGIAGNRLFPGTLSFDDPAVMDELVLDGSSSNHPPEAGDDVVDNTFSWEFSRLLTPTLSLSVSNGYIHRNWGSVSRSGLDETSLMLKTLLWQNDLHEVMVSAGFAGSIGRTGAQGVGANQFTTVAPSLFFGKGFGDAPAALAWLRPFAITGVLSAEVPTAGTSMTLDNSIAGQLVPEPFSTSTVLHWGLSIQYSTFYLTPRFTPGRLPNQEPLYQFIPLVELAVDSPVGKPSVATVNPGLVYVADKYQIGAEAILPLNGAAGHSTGVRAQLLLFTDDLLPSLFGKPVFGR